MTDTRPALVFCTRNRHKWQEVTAILGPDFPLKTLQDIGFDDELEEPYDSLEANAQAKAFTVYEQQKGACFAEDTGLFVEALAGEPGVYTARYAGLPPDDARNIRKLLKMLEGESNRNAYFKTVISFYSVKGTFQFEGICKGQIALEAAGDGGFGYDPVFIPEGYAKRFSELDQEIKNHISHRARAFEQFKNFLQINQIS